MSKFLQGTTKFSRGPSVVRGPPVGDRWYSISVPSTAYRSLSAPWHVPSYSLAIGTNVSNILLPLKRRYNSTRLHCVTYVSTRNGM